MLQDILSYVKGIYEELQDNNTLNPVETTAKRKRKEGITGKKLLLTVQDLEESYHKDYSETAKNTDEEIEEDESNPIEFNSVDYIIEDPNTTEMAVESITDETEIQDVKVKDESQKVVVLKQTRIANPKLVFPLRTKEELEILEQEIGLPHSTYRRQIIETIHTIQGNIKDHKVTIRTFFRVIFHDTLLINYTWKGYENKKALVDYKNLMTFLKKILVRWFPEDDLSDFSKCIQNHIKNAPSRIKHDNAK